MRTKELTGSNIQDIYSLTPLQEGIYFQSLIEKDAAYFVQMSFHLTGTIDPSLVEHSLQLLMNRHDALRTVFDHEKLDRLVQVVLKERKADFCYFDLRGLDSMSQEERLSSFREKDQQRSFDLKKDVLIRAALFQLTGDQFEFIWSFHHILLDGWGVEKLRVEYAMIYDCLSQGKPIALAPAQQFKTYIQWLEKQDREASRAYWKEYLRGFSQATGLPVTVVAGSAPGYGEQHLHIDRQKTARLKQLAARAHTTVNTLLRTIWGVLLCKYNGVADVVFGTIVSGRPPAISDVENIAGLFINTLPVRMQLDPDLSFSAALQNVHASAVRSQSYQYAPLAEIQADSELRQRLLDHIFIFQSRPGSKTAADSGNGESHRRAGIVEVAGAVTDRSSYDLDISFSIGDEVSGSFYYSREKYDSRLIENVAEQFALVAEQVTVNPDITIRAIDMLTEKDRHSILQVFNATDTPFPSDKTYIHLLEEATLARPAAIAVQCDAEKLTYEQLNTRANRLARHLQDRGLERGGFVPVLCARSIEMLTGIIGIMKSLGAYFTPDPNLPAGRIRAILKETKAEYLLTTSLYLQEKQAVLKEALQDTCIREIVCLDGPPDPSVDLPEILLTGWPAVDRLSSGNLFEKPMPGDLSFIVFTSGSTGKPKGALNEHRGMLNHCFMMIRHLGLDSSSRIAQTAPSAFDISVWQFLTALLCGGTTVIYPDTWVHDPEALIDRLGVDGISLLEWVPSYLSTILDLLDRRGSRVALPFLRTLIVCGEVSSPLLIRRWFSYFPGTHVVNAYGPAEASDDVTLYIIDRAPGTKQISIGKPLHNNRIYILDPEKRLCPVGIAGEICVGGIGVGQGYLNDPERTAAGFLKDHFASLIPSGFPVIEGRDRLYLTGDVGRYLPDGNLEFMGRKDHQIKLRGQRIELGEIEEALLRLDAIRQAVVTDFTDETQGRHLCAYVVLAPGHTTTPDSIRKAIGRDLPLNVIPAVILFLPALPLTANGKVDRRQLPHPGTAVTMKEYIAPRNDRERELASIWCAVLGERKWSIRDHFFEAGGHSLKATQVISRVNKSFGKRLELKDIFANPTIEDLALCLLSKRTSLFREIKPVALQESYEASPAQKRTWLLCQSGNMDTVFNMAGAYRMQGRLKVDVLQRVMSWLVARHESLRTSFRLESGTLYQVISPAGDRPFTLSCTDLRGQSDIAGLEAIARSQEAAQPFDLSTGPLIRASLLQTGDEEYLFLCTMHHIISDGWSLEVLINEFYAGYNAFTRGLDEPLPPLRIQYKDYTAWQREELKDERLAEHRGYWQQQLHGEIPPLELLTDYPRPATRSFAGAAVEFLIPEELTEGLYALTKRYEGTLFITLASLLNTLLYRYTGQNDIVIGYPIAGRDHPDLENQIGLFLNALPLRTKFREGQTFSELLHSVKQTVLDAFRYQLYPFDDMLEDLEVRWASNRSPLFDVVLILQNTNLEDNRFVELPGIRVTDLNDDRDTCKYDLSFAATELTEVKSIHLMINYNTDLFQENTILSMKKDILHLLQQVTADPDIFLSAGSLLQQEASTDLDFDFITPIN